MKTLSKLETRAMLSVIEHHKLSSEKILKLWDIGDDSSEIYKYFISRAKEEFGKYQEYKEILEKKPIYRFRSTEEVLNSETLRNNIKKKIDNYPLVREELIQAMIEKDTQKLRYVGNIGFVNKIVDKIKSKN